MPRRLSLVISELAIYSSTMALGLFLAWTSTSWKVPALVSPVEATMGNLILLIVMFIVFTTVVVKFAKSGRFSLHAAILVATFIGAEFLFSAVISGASQVPHIIAAIALIAIIRFVPIVLLHNVGVAIGIAGISVLLGLGITPPIAVVILAVLSIYDIIAVYRTRHMVVIAEQMMSSGAVFGFLIPATFRGLMRPWRRALDEREVMMLGSGDVGLPLVLVVSVVRFSFPAAVVVALFAIAGLMLTHWLFMHQRERAPMAALPPVAALSIIGYLVVFLLGL